MIPGMQSIVSSQPPNGAVLAQTPGDTIFKSRIYSSPVYTEVPDKNCKKPYKSGDPAKEYLYNDLEQTAIDNNLPISHRPHTRKQLCDAERRRGLAVEVRNFSPEVLACGKSHISSMKNMTVPQLKAIAEIYNNVEGKMKGTPIPLNNNLVKDELCANLIERDVIQTDPATGATTIKNLAVSTNMNMNMNMNSMVAPGTPVTVPVTGANGASFPSIGQNGLVHLGNLGKKMRSKGNPKSKRTCSKRSMVWVSKGKGRKSYCRSHKK